MLAQQVATGAEAGRLEVGLDLGGIATKVQKAEAQNRPSLWKRILPWYQPPREAHCSGLLAAMAFGRHSLGTPVGHNPSTRYTPWGILVQLDQVIALEILGARTPPANRVCNFGNFTHEETLRADAVVKKYCDALPAILRETHGKAAEVYISEINKARADYEASHDGLLVGLR